MSQDCLQASPGLHFEGRSHSGPGRAAVHEAGSYSPTQLLDMGQMQKVLGIIEVNSVNWGSYSLYVCYSVIIYIML